MPKPRSPPKRLRSDAAVNHLDGCCAGRGGEDAAQLRGHVVSDQPQEIPLSTHSHGSAIRNSPIDGHPPCREDG